jgi:hypothetical protein
MSKEQIEEMRKDLIEIFDEEYEKRRLITADFTAIKMTDKGYRKQSEPISCGHEKGVEWVKLPCKVGDILYVISQMKDKRILPFINEFEVTSISIKKKSIVIYHEMDGYIKTFKQTDFGKTVFLTKKEAERAVTYINVGSK